MLEALKATNHVKFILLAIVGISLIALRSENSFSIIQKKVDECAARGKIPSVPTYISPSDEVPCK